MPTIAEKLSEQIKEAMKAHDADKTTALRGMLSAIKYALLDAKNEAEDDTALKALRKMAKQRKESIEAFKDSRPDLAAKEQAELKLVEGFLPPEVDEAALRDAVKAAIAETGATTKRDFGKVMKAVQSKFAGAADGKRVQALINEVLV